MRFTKLSVGLAIASIILLIVAIRPLFTPYLIGTADGFAHKYRLVNFDHALSEGTLRPRWIGGAVLGYGAPLYIFNYSVPYYLVDAIYRLGFTIQISSQLYAAVTIIAAFFTMYLLASRLWGRWSGCIAATVYTFAPYHLHTIYSYEAWGEMLAFMFPPLLLYLLVRADQTESPAHKTKIILFIATVITWVLFILSHNISSYITSPIILLLGYMMSKRHAESIHYLGKIILFVGLLSAFFTIPALTLSTTIHMTTLLAKEIAMRPTYMIPVIQQIRVSYGALLGTPVVYQAFTVGIPILTVLCVGGLNIVSSFLPRNVKGGISPIGISLAVLCLASLLFTDPISDVLYIFRPLQYVLYPYRFLFVTSFTGSMLAGYLFKKSTAAGLCIIILAVLFGYPFLYPTLDVFSYPASFFSQPQLLRYAHPTLKNMGVEEFIPWTADLPFLFSEEQRYLNQHALPHKFILPPGTGNILAQSVRQEELSATVYAAHSVQLTVSTVYYPGWQATIDTTPVPVRHDRVGRITLTVPEGTHRVLLSFGYSTIERIGWIITLMGLILILASLRRIKT